MSATLHVLRTVVRTLSSVKLYHNTQRLQYVLNINIAYGIHLLYTVASTDYSVPNMPQIQRSGPHHTILHCTIEYTSNG